VAILQIHISKIKDQYPQSGTQNIAETRMQTTHTTATIWIGQPQYTLAGVFVDFPIDKERGLEAVGVRRVKKADEKIFRKRQIE
jgi:hypothetical protein